ncbi:MAG: hypothetical protein RLY70_3549 [Planctomycetota bacterium]
MVDERAAQVAAVAAAGGNEQSVGLAALAGAGESDLGLHHFPRVFQEPDGAFAQSRIGLLDQVELLVRIEDVDFDGERAAEDIEQGAEQFLAQFRRAVPQGGGRGEELVDVAGVADVEAVFPERLFGEQAVVAAQAIVVEPEESAVFEVRGGDAPAALQVAVEVVVDDAAERVVGRGAGGAADIGVGGVVVERQG